MNDKQKSCPPCNHNCNEGRTCPARLEKVWQKIDNTISGRNDMHYTGKFPRSLKQAFGPYAELHVDRRHWLDRNAKTIALIAAIAITLISILAVGS